MAGQPPGGLSLRSTPRGGPQRPASAHGLRAGILPPGAGRSTQPPHQLRPPENQERCGLWGTGRLLAAVPGQASPPPASGTHPPPASGPAGASGRCRGPAQAALTTRKAEPRAEHRGTESRGVPVPAHHPAPPSRTALRQPGPAWAREDANRLPPCRACAECAPNRVSGQVPGAHFLSPEIGPRVLCGWAGWTPDQARLCLETPAVREGQLVGGEWGREEAGRWPQPSPAHRAHRGC